MDMGAGARVCKGQRQLLRPKRDTYQAVGLAPNSVMSSAQPNSTAETVRTQELVHVFVKSSVSTSTLARSLVEDLQKFPKTTLPVCIELKKCFQCYLVLIGVLRTRS